MKNKKDIIDLLQNADEDTIGKITEAYPQHSKKNADRLFREIERRTSGDSSEFRGDTISGVERYRRPGIFRKITSVAACLAIVGAGVGTAYALSRSKAPASERNVQATTSTADTDLSVEDVYELCKHSSEQYSSYSAEYEIREKEYQCINDPNFYQEIETSNKRQIQVDKLNNTLWEKSTLHRETHGRKEKVTDLSTYYFSKGDKSVYSCSKNNDLTRSYYADLEYINKFSGEYAAELMVDEDSESLNSWTITGTKYVAGRKCVILKLNEATEECVGYVTFCIDTETGLCLEKTSEYTNTDLDTLETSKYEASTQANSITYNDNTGFVTGAQFKDFLKDFTPKGEFANDINYMSFLDDEPEAKTTGAVTTTEASVSATTVTTEITTAETTAAAKTTAETKTTTAAETTTAVTTSITFSDPESYLEFTEELSIARGEQKYFGFRTLCANLESVEIAGESQNDLKVVSSYSTAMMGNNYASFNIKCSENAKTGVHYIIIKHRPYTINNHMVTYSDEVFTVKIPITVTETGSDVFAMLDALDYHAISCDGIPTHKLTAPDGTVYYLHLADTTEGSYVWRRPSLIADADNEAPLTAAVIAALRAHWDELDIKEKEATRDFS